MKKLLACAAMALMAYILAERDIPPVVTATPEPAGSEN